MKHHVLVMILVALIATLACQQQGGVHSEETTATDGVFIHVKSGPDQPHAVLMALQMAVMMSETQDVAVYFDIEGIGVVLEDALDLSFSHFPSSRAQIAALAEKGVPVMACPGCLKAAGKSGADLMEGVRVADKETFFGFTDGRILTLDY
jgi:intracellular sulfur oxidation DsrE/DsrF family protein